MFLASSMADARKRKSDPEQSTVLKKRNLNRTKSVDSEISAVATSSLVSVLGLKALSDHTRPRIAIYIKKVVKGWNVLAKNLGFEGIEQLILLYARIQLPYCFFKLFQIAPMDSSANLRQRNSRTMRLKPLRKKRHVPTLLSFQTRLTAAFGLLQWTSSRMFPTQKSPQTCTQKPEFRFGRTSSRSNSLVSHFRNGFDHILGRLRM